MVLIRVGREREMDALKFNKMKELLVLNKQQIPELLYLELMKIDELKIEDLEMINFIDKYLIHTGKKKDKVSTYDLFHIYNKDKINKITISSFSQKLNPIIIVGKHRFGLATISGIKGYKLKNYDPETGETFLR